MTTDDQITDGMLRWEPGSLPTHTLERILMDGFADLWRDCYRRDDGSRIGQLRSQTAQERIFREKIEHLLNSATGHEWSVRTY